MSEELYYIDDIIICLKDTSIPLSRFFYSILYRVSFNFNIISDICVIFSIYFTTKKRQSVSEEKVEGRRLQLDG